jgi:mannose-6-phosphate isomerase-like protein (cupin superfamily)
VVSGTAQLIVNEDNKDETVKHQLGPGDFAFVPAWTEHCAENLSDLEARWVIFQGGASPVGAELQDWGGDEVTTK